MTNGWHRRGPTDINRPRGRAWMTKRKQVLQREPFCRHCAAKGKTTIAVIVDHIKPIAKGGDGWADDNLQPLCKPCDDIKTAADGVAVAKAKPVTGLDGWPIG